MKKSVSLRKNVPMPLRDQDRYPWDEMNIGDSFIYPGIAQSGYNIAKAASYRLLPKKFKARMVNGQVAIWRVE